MPNRSQTRGTEGSRDRGYCKGRTLIGAAEVATMDVNRIN